MMKFEFLAIVVLLALALSLVFGDILPDFLPASLLEQIPFLGR